MRHDVLITAPYILSVLDEFREQFARAGISIVTIPVSERVGEEELLSIVENFDGVICGDDAFTRRVLERAGRLRVISKWGTGIDSIDADAAAELGIRVCRTPDAFTDAVADSALGYILCFARRLVEMDHDIRDGFWVKPNSISLSECTLGIVGIGNIGRAVARRARAFGMRVLGSDTAQVFDTTGIELVPLDELLVNSDFVSLHCDLNPTSFHLIDQRRLRAMKRSAYLINTARGPIVDELDLTEALREQRIAGAGLDVFETEPLPVSSPLRSFSNCLLAPHNSNASPAARQKVHLATIANLIDGLQQATPAGTENKFSE